MLLKHLGQVDLTTRSNFFSKRCSPECTWPQTPNQARVLTPPMFCSSISRLKGRDDPASVGSRKLFFLGFLGKL